MPGVCLERMQRDAWLLLAGPETLLLLCRCLLFLQLLMHACYQTVSVCPLAGDGPQHGGDVGGAQGGAGGRPRGRRQVGGGPRRCLARFGMSAHVLRASSRMTQQIAMHLCSPPPAAGLPPPCSSSPPNQLRPPTCPVSPRPQGAPAGRGDEPRLVRSDGGEHVHALLPRARRQGGPAGGPAPGGSTACARCGCRRPAGLHVLRVLLVTQDGSRHWSCTLLTPAGAPFLPLLPPRSPTRSWAWWSCCAR